MTDYFTAISSIATLITAILIYLTLREMAKQRKNSIIPEVVPINQMIIAGKDPIAETDCPTFWLKKYPHEEGTDDIESNQLRYALERYSLSFFNLGNGAAKNISLEWGYNLKTLCDHINRLSQELSSEFHIELTEDNWLNFKKKNKARSSVNINLDLKENLDYILPSSVERRGAQIRFPASYQNLVSLYVQIVAQKQKHIPKDSLLEQYPLELDMSYFDIAGNKILKSFKFKVRVHAIMGVENGEVAGFYAMLDVSKSDAF